MRSQLLRGHYRLRTHSHRFLRRVVRSSHAPASMGADRNKQVVQTLYT